jgi:hypothetical protein
MAGFFQKLDNIKLGAPGSVLACETDGFTMRGAVIHTGVSGMDIGEVVESRALDFKVAVEEVISRLKNLGKKIPKKAILVTPSAVGTLLEIPVPPNSPRPDMQMHELVRWELEPLFGQQNDIWSIGALLMGRGYINAEQRKIIALERKDRIDENSADKVKRRSFPFGEVALSLDMVKREQVDECLALQEKLILVNDELICGWAPQEMDEYADEGEEGLYQWNGVGLGRAMATTWVKAFRMSHVSLDWIYPQLGCAFASINGSNARSGEQMMVEIRQEQMAVVRGRSGQLAAISVAPIINGQPDPDSVFNLCQDQLRPDVSTMHLFAPVLRGAELSEQLATQTGREIEPLGAESKTKMGQWAGSFKSLAALSGASSHFLGRVEQNSLARVRAQPPKPPLTKRKELYPYVGALLVILAILAYDASLQIKSWQNKIRLEELDAQYKEKLEEKQRMDQAVQQGKILEEEIADLGKDLVKANKWNKIFEDVLMARRKMVPGVLNALADSTGDEVILFSVDETDNWSGMHITAWGLTHTGAQLFISQLNKSLEPWGLEVENAQVSVKQGQLGLDGYGISLWLFPKKDEKDKKA